MGRILTIYNTVNVSANINAWHLRTSKPELCSRVRWRGAAKSGVSCTVMTKVVFVIYSSRLSVKFTASWVAKPAVHVQSVSVRVRSENCAVGALISTNVDKLRENTEVMCWRLHKKIQTFYRNFPVIPVVHPTCRKITSGSPVSGDVSDWLHTGHRQTVATPFRCILVDWQVVQVEWFACKRAIVLERVGLDQSPCHTSLGTKVAINWERNVVLVNNVVDTTGFGFLKQHYISAWFRRGHNVTLKSTKTCRTCAVESSLCDVTHFMTRASMLTGVGLTALVMTSLIRTGFMKTSLIYREKRR